MKTNWQLFVRFYFEKSANINLFFSSYRDVHKQNKIVTTVTTYYSTLLKYNRGICTLPKYFHFI